MQVEAPDIDLIAITMNKHEATLLRQWIDKKQNTFESEVDCLMADLSDELFDLTYEPRRD